MRLQTYSNGSKHIIEQCLMCGFITNHLKKKDFKGWEDLPNYNSTLLDKYHSKVKNWNEQRKEIYNKKYWIGDKLPEFDIQEAYNEYEQLHPLPARHYCEHNTYAPRMRNYKTG